MNKKRILDAGRAALSIVLTSSMFMTTYSVPIYAQETEEPVIVEENNVSDPNQEKEDESQIPEGEQSKQETVQSEESVDNNVQNTEPQSEEETVEPKKSSQDITFNNPSGVHYYCDQRESSLVVAYGADWMEFQGVRYTDKTTYNQKECIAPEAIRQALIAVPSGTMQTFTIRVGVEGDDVGIEYTFYGDKLDPELTVIEANANYILFEGNEPLDPERTAYESYEENGHYYAKYDLSSAKVGFGSNTIADSTGKNATWFMYEKKADGTVEVHLMDKVPTVEVTSGDSLYKLTDGAVITKKLSKNSFKVSGYGIRSVQAGENMYLYGEKVQNSDLAVTSIDYPITLEDKKTYQLRYENKGGEFSNVNFSVNYSLGSYVDTLNATIKEQEEKELNAENYTPDTWSVYEQALQNAKASAENPFTDNTAMQSAESALKSAFEGLKEQVKDTEAPEVKVTYSNKNGSQVTKEDVTVTLTANEDIQDIEGWTRVDSKTLQKVHSENGKFNVTVKDLAGNETKVKYEVKRIDKVAPVIEGVKDGEVTNKDVEFTVKEQSISKIIIDEKEYNEKNAPKKVSGEGKHTIKVVDKAGNETSVSFTIDQTAPKFTVKEESKGYDGVYSKLSLKLYDAHKVDYVEINGKKKDLSDNQWSDLDDQNAGYKEGKNTVVLYDVAGNSAEFTFIYDKTGPTVNVKDSSVEKDGYYSRLDLKLYDANNVDYAEINGKRLELTNNQWSDINHANAGYVDGENTIVVYDQAGNSTTVKFMIGEPVKADKTALQEKIDEAKKLEEDNYTEETWSKLEEALEAAEKVNDNEKATQEEIDKAVANLDTAIKGLEEVVINITANVNGTPVSGETLQAAVEEAGLTTGLINKVEFVSGKVTKADLEYIAKYADELVFKLSDTLTYVGDNDTATTVFPNTSQNWSQLESLTLEGFTEIAASAFYNHEDLRTVNLTGVEIIGGSAFNVSKNASKKEMTVTISDSIKEIGSKAFYGQNNRPLNLTLNVKDPSTITLNKNAFDGINTSLSKVNVPEGSLQNYLTNLDITKAFNSSTNTKWNKMIVNDPAYQLMTFQYDADYEGVTFNAYIKNGSTLSSISLEDVQTAINNRIPEGYAFAGWNTAVDGTGTDITDETVFPIEAERIYIKLAVAADKTKLQEQIDAVKDLKKEDYVASTWEELQTALAEANKVNEDTSATQDAVIKATEALKTAIENLVKAGMSHVEKITQNDDGSLTISFDRKIKDENGSRSKHSLTFDEETNTITVANVTAEGPLFVHVSTKDYDNRFSHHNLFRDADGTWKVVEEYITGATYVNEKPKISYIVGDEEKTLELQDGVTEYTIETTSEDVSLKIKGHDLEYVTFEYTDKAVPGYSKRFTPSSTDDHTTISFPVGFGAGTYKLGISDQSMSTNAGRYTNIKLTIKVVEPANKTALQEQIEEAEDRNENYYTADTWTKLQEALTSAKAVNDDDSASQTEVDEATSALKDALKALVYEVEGEIYLVIGDEKIPLINLTNTADQSYWEDPYVYDKPLSSNPKIRVEGKDVYQILIKDSNTVGEGRGWKGLASNHVKSKDVSLFAASGYGNDTYKVSVGVDSKIFRIAIEIKDYTLPSNEALKAILDKANAIEKGNYTDESFEALQEAIKLSTTTYQINKNLWDADQAILDRATKRVEDAIAALKVNSTDKTKLQSLVDEVKDYNAEGITGFDVFQDQLKLAQDVLADPEATQEDINKRVIQLEGRYYIVQLKALNAKYKDTISGKSSVIYTTDSMKALVEMYEGVQDKSFSASKVLKQTDVDTAKAKLEEYQKLEKELVKASASDAIVGINESALARSANKGQGTFEILSKTVVEGGYELTIKFTNDAMHPIFGESYTNYDGTETKFAKFGGTANAKMYVDAYDSSLGAISRPSASNTSFEALEGNTSKTPGFTTKITVPENTAYVTLSYTYSGATAHSAGYWVVGNVQEVVEVDKTALEEAITSAQSAINNTKHFTESEGLEDAEKVLEKAQGVYEDPNANQEDVNAVIEELNAAISNMKEKEVRTQLVSVSSSDSTSVTFETNVLAYNAYIYEDSGRSTTYTASKHSDNGKNYITVNNLKSGENYFYVWLGEFWNVDHTNNFWVYVNTETGEAKFGKVNPVANPTLTLHVGDEDVVVTATSSSGQEVEVPEGTKELKATLTGEDLYRVYVQLTGTPAQENIYSAGDHQSIDFDIHNPDGELVEGEYTINIKAGWNGTVGPTGITETQRTTKYKGFTLKFVEVEVDKTALKEAIDAADEVLIDVNYNTSVTDQDAKSKLDTLFSNARKLYDNPEASQNEVDQMTTDLTEATEYLKTKETRIAILSVDSIEGSSITFVTNNTPYRDHERPQKNGVSFLGDYSKGQAGSNSNLKFDRSKDGEGTSYTIVNNLEEGENFFYIRFKGCWTGMQDTYWVYVNTTTKDADFGKVGDAVDPSAVVKVGDKDISVSDKEQTISVQDGEKPKLVVTGEDIGYATVTKDGKVVEQTLFPLVNHKTLEVDASEAGEYQVKVVYSWKSWKPSGVYTYNKEATYNFTIEEAPAVNKTELQSLYDDVKGTKSDNSYFEYFNQELQDTKTLLENASATQEEIDKQIIDLNAKYYALLVAELNETYDPNTNSFNEYTTDSLIPVIKMWGNTNEKINKDYYESESNENVGQSEQWYNDYKKAIDGLTKASGSELKVGLNTDSATKYSQYQGHFEVVSKKPVEGDSTRYEVTIQFINDGKHPIYGETKVNSSNTTTYKPYTDLSNSSIINVDVYDSGFGHIKQAVVKNKTTLPGSNNYNDGIQATYEVESNAKYLTFEFKAKSSSNPTYSEGYFVVDNIPLDVDKTELQSLYDKVKDLQSDVSSFKYFTTQLKAAKNVLDNPQATQNEIDLAIINLEAKYYAVKVAELNVKYNPENDFNFTEYTTESLVPVMNMWGITHNRSNGNYSEDSERGDVGQMKGWYEEYTKAIEGLKEATDESVYIGITSESTKSDDEQGSFEVVSAEKVIVDGQEKIKLVVNYNNTGIHPIYGESLLNANGTKKFRKITSMSEKISFRYEAYNSEMKHQISAGMSDKTKLPDATNWSAGMQGVCYLDPSISYVTFVINNELYSSWIYRIPELSSPVDKSGLQSLIEETKDYQSDDSYYDEFQEALTNAQNVLSNEEATQEEVDEAHENLELYYYRSQAYALALKYKPVGAASGKYDGTFDYAKYEVEGALKVINAYYGVMNLGAYPKVADVKTAYETLKAAIPELKEVTGEPRSMLVGPNEDLIELTESRGYFTFEESPAENGMINLHIVYVNNGINPINGKDFGEFEGRKFTALKSTLRLQCQTYKGAGKIIDFKDDITLMGGNEATSVDGFEVDVVVEPGRYNVYMELEGVEVYSQGYYYTSESAATGSETSAVIEANDRTINVGEDIDLMEGVRAYDGTVDLTASIEVTGTVDNTQSGQYEVTYKVTDQAGNTTEKTITITVNALPVFHAGDLTITVGDAFDPMQGVTATDAEDGDLTGKIVITKNTVDTSKAGKYTVVYEVTDSHGTRVVRTIYVTVQQKTTDTGKEDSNKDSAKDTAQTSTQTNILARSVLGIASLGALLAVLFKRKHY